MSEKGTLLARRTIFNAYSFTMTEILKPGRVGSFAIENKIIRKGAVLNGYDRHGGRIKKIKYDFDYPTVRLSEGGNVWMSDSQLEVEAAAGAVEVARGDVLIGGLGIGLLPTLIKMRASIKSVDIVELHQEVIDLVFHQIASTKMRAVCDDVLHYLSTTDKRYDFIHIDIWGSITAPIREIDGVRQRAQRCLKPDGIVWCWLQELYDRIKEKIPKTPTWQTSPAAIHEPCLICGKTLRFDYAGLCMDCADDMGLSELYEKKDSKGGN